MKTVMLIFGIVLILGALTSVGFCAYNLVKCYKGKKSCLESMNMCFSKNQFMPIIKFERAIKQFEEAIKGYYVTVSIDMIIVILNSIVIYVNYL
jgi:hypothetical protein